MTTELIYVLVMTHITIMCVTLYLHRSQAHMGVIFHPSVSHFMRFWLWLTTGMVTKQWVAVHRKHHSFSDKPGDPHSPHVWGIVTVLLKGALLYHEASKDSAMVEQYGKRTPDDWIENNLYTLHSKLGITCMLIIDVALFNGWGLIIWAIQMLWVPFHAAGVINGLAHWWGYRNGESKDNSTNISPIGLIIGGEELHNNHHLQPASPKFSIKWYELDIGWAYIKLFEKMGLAKVS